MCKDCNKRFSLAGNFENIQEKSLISARFAASVLVERIALTFIAEFLPKRSLSSVRLATRALARKKTVEIIQRESNCESLRN